jgi:DNA recombination protein Rad52
MTFNAKQIEALEGPLARDHVKQRVQARQQLSYIEGWVAIAEANRIFGFDAWDRETVTLIETNRELVNLSSANGGRYQQWRVGYLAKVRVRVDGTVREGTGFGSGMAKPEALGEAIESAAKEAETDAMKRALMTFGNPFGLALYDKTQANVADMPSDGAGKAQEGPRLVSGTTGSVKRLTSARAKEIGLDKKIKTLVNGCESVAAVSAFEANFDKLTEEAPLSWLDSIRNDLILRREELAGTDAHETLDAEYRAVVG